VIVTSVQPAWLRSNKGILERKAVFQRFARSGWSAKRFFSVLRGSSKRVSRPAFHGLSQDRPGRWDPQGF